MTFSYEILPEKGTILLRCQGHFTFEQLRAGIERLWSDPRYRVDYDGIADLTDTSVGVSLSDLRALLDFLRNEARTSTGRWAAVAVSPLAAACAVLYQQACAQRHTCEVFSTWDAACRYLEVELPPDWSPVNPAASG